MNKRSIRWIAAALLLGVALVFASEAWIGTEGSPRCTDDLEKLPQVPVAVVLGTTPTIAGRWRNLYFDARIESAAKLYHAGKVRALIVSGDNGTYDYDEPAIMKEQLVALGVPAERIVCDCAGFRTLDSVVRAKEVFGQSRVIIVSQRFHNLRALYLAKHHGLEAWGYDAADPPSEMTLRTRLREKFACVKALLDVHVQGTRPRFLGEPIAVP